MAAQKWQPNILKFPNVNQPVYNQFTQLMIPVGAQLVLWAPYGSSFGISYRRCLNIIHRWHVSLHTVQRPARKFQTCRIRTLQQNRCSKLKNMWFCLMLAAAGTIIKNITQPSIDLAFQAKSNVTVGLTTLHPYLLVFSVPLSSQLCVTRFEIITNFKARCCTVSIFLMSERLLKCPTSRQ